MGQGGRFNIGIDLLDHRMLTVGFISGDGIEDAGGEEHVVAEQGKQGLVALSARSRIIPVASLLRGRFTAFRTSTTNLTAPRAEFVGPFRRRQPMMIGADKPVLTMASREFKPRTLE